MGTVRSGQIWENVLAGIYGHVASGPRSFAPLRMTHFSPRSSRRLKHQQAGVYAASGEAGGPPLQGAHERDEIRLLGGGEFRFEDEIEELHCVLEREQASVMQIGR
jgi:hypothetical protein